MQVQNQDIPKNVLQGCEDYKVKVLKSNILLNASKELLFKISDNKNEIESVDIHILGISSLLKSVIEVLAYSSLILDQEINQNLDSLQNAIIKVEKINPKWLPHIIETEVNEENKTHSFYQQQVKDNYLFLSNLLLKDKTQIPTSSEQKDIINKLDLMINGLSKLVTYHKVDLFNCEYFYTINIEKGIVEGNIFLKSNPVL